MADEKFFADELLSDDELDNVAGGYLCDGKSPNNVVAAKMSKVANFQFNLYQDRENEYFYNGKQITRDEAFALYQKMFDQGVFTGIPAITRDDWYGDERTDIDPAFMSAAFINGEITGGEDF